MPNPYAQPGYPPPGYPQPGPYGYPPPGYPPPYGYPFAPQPRTSGMAIAAGRGAKNNSALAFAVCACGAVSVNEPPGTVQPIASRHQPAR